MYFAKNIRVERYSVKYLSGRLCGDRVDQWVEVEHIRGHADRARNSNLKVCRQMTKQSPNC